MNGPAITTQRLSHTHPDGTRALHDVSFLIRQGEKAAIIGPNGAGKSTLLLHLNGCLLPTEGRVTIGNLNVGKATLPEVRRLAGMTFQHADDQLFMPTVGDDVAFGPRNLGLSPKQVDERVTSALAAVDAVHLIDRPPYRLSGGEKRRVAIATVLSMEPDIIVMDEPTTGLDARGRRGLIELLKQFSHTIVIATHDLDLVHELCNRVIVLHQGTVAADGTPGDILGNSALLAQCGLEPPPSYLPCPCCGKKRTGQDNS